MRPSSRISARALAAVLAGAVAAAGPGCRRPLPTRPEQLAPGTFAVAVRGHRGAPDTSAAFDDQIAGTACRVARTVLMETSDGALRLSLQVPAFPGSPTTFGLRARPDPVIHFSPGAPPGTPPVMERPAPDPPGLGPVARGYLTYAGEGRPSHGSLVMDSGTVTVVLSDSGELRGAVRAHLREGLLHDGTESASPSRVAGELVGVFRVDARDVCEYAQSARSDLTRR